MWMRGTLMQPTWVVEVLQDRHLVLERGLLLGREAHLVDHLDRDCAARDPVHPAVHDPELPGAQNLVIVGIFA
jgi:hypothetical protein